MDEYPLRMLSGIVSVPQEHGVIFMLSTRIYTWKNTSYEFPIVDRLYVGHNRATWSPVFSDVIDTGWGVIAYWTVSGLWTEYFGLNFIECLHGNSSISQFWVRCGGKKRKLCAVKRKFYLVCSSLIIFIEFYTLYSVVLVKHRQSCLAI